MMQASSEHPLAKAIMEYARHFHFFDEPSDTDQSYSEQAKFSGWLQDVSDFSVLPGKGIQCSVDGKWVLVSFQHHDIHNF